MRKILLLFVVVLSASHLLKAQCTPSFLFTSLSLPGVFPPDFPISSIPMVGVNDGEVGIPYSQTLTLIVLEDTIMDVASFLPSAAVAAMSLAGISTVMVLNVNHVTFDVVNLPNGLSYACDQSNCEYPSGVDGCILINGNPTQSGNYAVPVGMQVNLQIPPITDPILGTIIFAGMNVDLPSFSAVEYDLFIDGSTIISELTQKNFLYPNPTESEAILSLEFTSNVVVYNVLGKDVLKKSSIQGNLSLLKSDLGKGIFYIMIESKNKTEIIKLIIK